MADMTKVVLLGGAAAAVYWFYFRTPSPAAGATQPLTTTGGATGGTPPPSGPSLDSLFAAMVAAAANDPGVKANGMMTPDGWDFYLMRVYPGFTAPDPVQIFGGRPAMTATAYWAGMAPWLRTNKGLSGIGRYGLGAVGSLAYGGLGRGR
jgi:hypothetical protein